MLFVDISLSLLEGPGNTTCTTIIIVMITRYAIISITLDSY